MFINAANQVVGNASIKCGVFLVGQNVNEKHHLDCFTVFAMTVNRFAMTVNSRSPSVHCRCEEHSDAAIWGFA